MRQRSAQPVELVSNDRFNFSTANVAHNRVQSRPGKFRARRSVRVFCNIFPTAPGCSSHASPRLGWQLIVGQCSPADKLRSSSLTYTAGVSLIICFVITKTALLSLSRREGTNSVGICDNIRTERRGDRWHRHPLFKVRK